MSYRKRPTGEPRRGPLTRVASAVRNVVNRYRHHVATWPRRYVEMQAEAFGDN
ncbi:Dyp-type peroxidase [Halorarius litoreus]|uniref:Dyp-type peroxidase n=1 Tax=Halorarius litoreus TaxID=2962676 RepID=UPI0020CD2D64|nr:Dyp-type peroxidase [Halorarius litoreus]